MSQWWQSRGAVALAALAATIPLWVVTIPPLIDLVGHIGRYHVQLHLGDSPALQANWAYHWRLIGNLGSDLLMEPLGRVFGIEGGARVLAGLILILTITGMARLARAAHGVLPATAWAAFPFAMAYPWQYGLVNYCLGVACALHMAAHYYRHPREGGDPTPVVSTGGQFRSWAPAFAGVTMGALSVLLWVVHIYGWAVFAVLIVARTVAGRPVKVWPRAIPGLLPLGLPLLLMAALSYGTAGAAAATLGWFDFGYKALALTWTLRDQHQWFDMGCLIAAMLLIYAGVRSKAFVVDRSLGLAALFLLIALLVLPYQLLGSAFSDARLWPVVFMVALLAIRPVEATGRLAAVIALGAALVFGVRIAATTAGFAQYDTDYARHLKALDLMPRGARVAVFTEFPCDVPWRRPRVDHLDGVAIVRRDVFTNGQWDVPGAQLLVPLAARGTRYNSDPSQLVMGCGDLRPALAARIADFPRDRFDLVWLIGYRPATLPRYAGLTPLFADDRTVLYRIDK
ncbi:hypothetical protein [Sphingomonas sp. SUN039]|uniref:hypothetical protein n=1 Tax=Sphingomonas sp. SUN039 TaxID=2937787 RepID=UPI0021644CEE|nr:hypothetical protein [Sphingomonas sp. SUN039]UVO54985.1 hypothetical protein M0209_12920 [Sphingomonas sp. SUN039]